ncbi:MAG: hypothetical protein PHF86_05890 [Candidatus Nanoarchaeia archaeon]|nr:hypothetical protein [Candidatus Nanoarchaeia archaeon]
MEIKDKIILGLIIVVVCAVAFTAGLTGRAITTSCMDTDRGDLNLNEIYEKGTITGISENQRSFERTDYCVNTNYLKEYGCNRDVPARYESRLVICESGCSDGACIK